ncbi:hypothetical protein KAU33_01060 [Candidatus Dependentiae bacterium]|nr:hypothetical protein [Candidatus Dependentiae bacterium]
MKKLLLILFLVLLTFSFTFSEKTTETIETKRDDIELPEVIIHGEEDEDNEKKGDENAIKEIEINIEDDIDKEITEIKKQTEKEDEAKYKSRNEENFISIGAGTKSTLNLKGYVLRNHGEFNYRLSGFYKNTELISEDSSLTNSYELAGTMGYKFENDLKLLISLKTNFKDQHIPELDKLSVTSNLIQGKVILEKKFQFRNHPSSSVSNIENRNILINYPDEKFIPGEELLPKELKFNYISLVEKLRINYNQFDSIHTDFGYSTADDYNLLNIGLYIERKTSSFNYKTGILVQQFKSGDSHSRVFPFIKGEWKLKNQMFLEAKFNPEVELYKPNFFFDSNYSYSPEYFFPAEHVLRTEVNLKKMGYVKVRETDEKMFYMLSFGFFVDKVINYYYPITPMSLTDEKDLQVFVNYPVMLYGLNIKNSYVFSEDLTIATSFKYTIKENQEESRTIVIPKATLPIASVYGVPSLLFDVIVKYQYSKKLSGDLTLKYIGDEEYFNRNGTETNSYFTGNISSKYVLNELFYITLDLENFTNSHHYITSDFKSAGLKVIFGMGMLF